MSAAPRVLVAVQARTGSSRLPGKVLMPLAGRPMLAFQLERLAGLDAALAERGLPAATVLVATSDRPGDDAIEALALDAGVPVVRGPEDDVLGRYRLALERVPADVVVRLTGDCPLTDPAIVADTVALHLAESADYTSNVLPRSFPKGLDVEVLGAATLRAIDREAEAGPDREHVTPYAYRHPARFRLANLHSGRDLGEERWTVDTADDIDRVRAITDRLADPVAAGWLEILAAVGEQVHPGPGQVHLRPLPDSGATPDGQGWARRWEARAGGGPIGTVSVVRTGGPGTAATRVELDVPASDAARTQEAVDRLLDGDQQVR